MFDLTTAIGAPIIQNHVFRPEEPTDLVDHRRTDDVDSYEPAVVCGRGAYDTTGTPKPPPPPPK